MVDNSSVVVLVTGASRGIGRATASLLAREGLAVYGSVRNPSSSNDLGFETVPLDVTSDESVRSCVSDLIGRTGRIDVLVNNAGVGILGAIEETSLEEAKALFDANLFGTARMVNAVLPSMRARKRGLIINLGSLAPSVPMPFHAYLSASKAAIITYSDALRLELKPFRIHVSVVEPGMIATHHLDGQFDELKAKRPLAEYSGTERQALPVMEKGQRYGTSPDRVAQTILRIIRSPSPRNYYRVGREKWLIGLTRILPASSVDWLMERHFHLKSATP